MYVSLKTMYSNGGYFFLIIFLVFSRRLVMINNGICNGHPGILPFLHANDGLLFDFQKMSIKSSSYHPDFESCPSILYKKGDSYSLFFDVLLIL
jgi:hypothetical protein